MTGRSDKESEVLVAERRRCWSTSEKLAMVRETYEPVSLVARKHGVNPNQVFHWRKLVRQFAAGAWGKTPGKELKSAQAHELEKLRQELSRVKIERDTERFYNPKRRHPILGHISPVAFERCKHRRRPIMDGVARALRARRESCPCRAPCCEVARAKPAVRPGWDRHHGGLSAQCCNGTGQAHRRDARTQPGLS